VAVRWEMLRISAFAFGRGSGTGVPTNRPAVEPAIRPRYGGPGCSSRSHARRDRLTIEHGSQLAFDAELLIVPDVEAALPRAANISETGHSEIPWCDDQLLVRRDFVSNFKSPAREQVGVLQPADGNEQRKQSREALAGAGVGAQTGGGRGAGA
jgi:hypothetical protein